MPREKIVLLWSGGKDSARALAELQRSYEICGLLTTFTEGYDRVTMHGVRRALIEAQAEALGERLRSMTIRPSCSNQEYGEQMRKILLDLKAQGVRKIASGDIFLEDVRRYREERLKEVEMELITPLWGRSSLSLLREFFAQGFRATTVCVSTRWLGAEFVGRELDERFLADLPSGVDPCGENGEFHSFVYDGPLFRHPVRFQLGETVLRDGHCYCDLIPAQGDNSL
ncbi:diphthine--ammonia ligase [Candidatus Acetothermia bacterium]|jgi:uncharacterized protein (TIGR00290 family)|nr:diphthine--ammonia ligase [Candidatus Acetothermia bacterium]MCI2431316.1 diphthine--ammonia ligase [Candidatus Acetothermia bacterium]MCI2436970.1 diphthine--ammonia ligase [Candidatus Acetothermia bacterium]